MFNNYANMLRFGLKLCRLTFVTVLVRSFCINLSKAEHQFHKNANVLNLSESPEIICVDSNPNVIYTWFKDESQINNKTGKYLTRNVPDPDNGQTDSILQILNFTEADIGPYKCVASDGGGEGFPNLNTNPFKVDGTVQTLTVGDTLIVLCNGWGYPPPAVSWAVNGQNIVGDGNRIFLDNYKRNTITLENGRLTIKNVVAADSNVYTCNLENGLGVAISANRVIVKEICLSNPCQHNGSCINIANGYTCQCPFRYSGTNCEIASLLATNAVILIPSETSVIACNSADQGALHWFRHGKELLNTTGKYVIDNTTNSVSILNPGPEDVGDYECRTNYTSSTAVIFAKPFVQNGKSQTIALGSTLEVPCQGWGYPAPQVTWYGDDKRILPDGSRIIFEDYPTGISGMNLTNGLLKIKNVQYSDYKNYKCRLDNTYGSSNGTTLVRIKDQFAALWPFIGIILELLALCAAISWYERTLEKKRAEEKRRENAYIRLKSKRFENRSTSSYLNSSTIHQRQLQKF